MISKVAAQLLASGTTCLGCACFGMLLGLLLDGKIATTSFAFLMGLQVGLVAFCIFIWKRDLQRYRAALAQREAIERRQQSFAFRYYGGGEVSNVMRLH